MTKFSQFNKPGRFSRPPRFQELQEIENEATCLQAEDNQA